MYAVWFGARTMRDTGSVQARCGGGRSRRHRYSCIDVPARCARSTATSEPLRVPTVARVSDGGARRVLPGRAGASTRGGVTRPDTVPVAPCMPLRVPVRSTDPAADVARTSTISSNAVVAVWSGRRSGPVVFMDLSASVHRRFIVGSCCKYRLLNVPGQPDRPRSVG